MDCLEFEIALVDFDLTIEKTKKARFGTPNWMAPEILRGEKYEEASDVYSFGVVLLELLTGKIPHRGLSIPQITGLVGFNENYEVSLFADLVGFARGHPPSHLEGHNLSVNEKKS